MNVGFAGRRRRRGAAVAAAGRHDCERNRGHRSGTAQPGTARSTGMMLSKCQVWSAMFGDFKAAINILVCMRLIAAAIADM